MYTARLHAHAHTCLSTRLRPLRACRLVNPSGRPECMLQDWLGARGLDRGRLAILASNAMQVEAYEEWMQSRAAKEVSGTRGGVGGGSQSDMGLGAAVYVGSAECTQGCAAIGWKGTGYFMI